MFRSIVVFVGGLTSLAVAPLFGQNAVLGQKYGYGVHAYFADDYVQAHEQLTAAITGGSRDPRAYYFRGLANLKLGRDPEAAQDFGQGASLESKDLNKFYNVSKALERVQGAARIELEKHRVEARMAAMEANERFRKARYEAIQREEKRVTRPMPPAPLEPLVAPEPEAAPAAAAADVFAAPAEEKAASKAATPPAAEAKPVAKEKPAAEKKPAAEAEKPAAEEKPKVEADPFAQ